MNYEINYYTDYKGYVFVNTGLSSIQKGVQGSHAIVEVFNNTPFPDELSEPIEPRFVLTEWATNYKTLIFLNGGFHQSILDNYMVFSELCDKLKLPHALFREDVDTMNGMATAFAGIIPHTVYEADVREYDMGRAYCTNSLIAAPEEPINIALARFLQSFKLAI